jgi:hypothetical protein
VRLDLDDAELDRLAERLAPTLIEALAPAVADLVVSKLQAAQSAQLVPLSDILGISKRAALGRLSNDPELRALGLRVGRQLRFRRHEVESLLAERHRERTGLRAVEGEGGR